MIRLTMTLADAAQVADGKLYILGAGWNELYIGPNGQTGPHAVALLLQVPWDQTNTVQNLELSLFDADGQLVDDGAGPLTISASGEVGRPPGATPGAHLPVPLAFPVRPMTLAVGRYVWEASINGVENDAWVMDFVAKPHPHQIKLVS